MEYQKAFPNGTVNHTTSNRATSCRFTEGVRCSNYDSHGRRIGRNCETCGHNPEVAKERLEKYCKKHGITIKAEE